MSQVLSISYRPKTLSQMVGAEKLAKKIRGHFTNGREPKAWMFIGPTGSGKTTLAYILATSLQCTHQEVFGDPCKDCRRTLLKFDIVDLNTSEKTGKDEIVNATRALNYKPRPGSRRRVFILDEAQRLSESSQNYLLKPFEQCPDTTVWIICTTEPERLLPTLRSRCMTYEMPVWGIEEIRALVEKAIKKAGGTRNVNDLAEALLEANVRSPRLIVNAVEKYLSDPSCEPEEAAKLEVVSLNIHNIWRSLVKGDWRGIAQQLRNASPTDATAIRLGMMNLLQTSLLGEETVDGRAGVFAKAIKALATVEGREQLSIVSAVLFDLCPEFKRYTR